MKNNALILAVALTFGTINYAHSQTVVTTQPATNPVVVQTYTPSTPQVVVVKETAPAQQVVVVKDQTTPEDIYYYPQPRTEPAYYYNSDAAAIIGTAALIGGVALGYHYHRHHRHHRPPFHGRPHHRH